LINQYDTIKNHGSLFILLGNRLHDRHGNLSFAKARWGVQQLASVASFKSFSQLFYNLKLMFAQL
jgi:hypothetical protein